MSKRNGTILICMFIGGIGGFMMAGGAGVGVVVGLFSGVGLASKLDFG